MSRITQHILLTLTKLKCATGGMKGSRDRTGARDVHKCVYLTHAPATEYDCLLRSSQFTSVNPPESSVYPLKCSTLCFCVTALTSLTLSPINHNKSALSFQGCETLTFARSDLQNCSKNAILDPSGCSIKGWHNPRNSMSKNTCEVKLY